MVRAWSPYAGVSVSAWNATPVGCQAQWALQPRASAHDARDDAARRGRGGRAGVDDGRAPEQSPSTLAPTIEGGVGSAQLPDTPAHGSHERSIERRTRRPPDPPSQTGKGHG